jgi:TolB-like protein
MSSIVRFDCYEVDVASGQLFKRGLRIPLREKSIALLTALLEHPRELVTREELRHRLWHDDVFVDFDNNLNTVLGRLREALSDSAEHPRFVETLPKRGYRFIAEVHSLPSTSAAPTTNIPRLLVLPFVNLSGDPGDDYFSDAMTDEIITAIAAVSPKHLGVIARTTAMRFKGSRKNVGQIGHEVAVDYVLEGAVRRTERQLGINIQLIKVSDQTHVFAKKYLADADDIFRMQDIIAQEVAAETATPRADESSSASRIERASRKPTQNLAAYDLYLRGRFQLYKLSAEGFKQAKQYLENALERDPEFALACDALAELYWYLGFFGYLPPKGTCSRGLFYAVRALEIDSSLADTHALLGMYRKQVDYDWPEVRREMSRALELNPTSPVVRLRYAMGELMPFGRLEEAITQIKMALESDPLSMIIRSWLGVMLWFDRQYEQAIEEARRLIELDTNYEVGYLIVGQARCMQHAFDEAVVVLRKASELSGNSPMVRGWLGLALAQGGNVTEARNLLQDLSAVAGRAYVPPSSFAWIYFGLGELDGAFFWLDRAIEARDPMMTPIKSYSFLDPVRNDLRFATLLRKMNLDV